MPSFAAGLCYYQLRYGSFPHTPNKILQKPSGYSMPTGRASTSGRTPSSTQPRSACLTQWKIAGDHGKHAKNTVLYWFSTCMSQSMELPRGTWHLFGVYGEKTFYLKLEITKTEVSHQLTGKFHLQSLWVCSSSTKTLVYIPYLINPYFMYLYLIRQRYLREEETIYLAHIYTMPTFTMCIFFVRNCWTVYELARSWNNSCNSGRPSIDGIIPSIGRVFPSSSAGSLPVTNRPKSIPLKLNLSRCSRNPVINLRNFTIFLNYLEGPDNQKNLIMTGKKPLVMAGWKHKWPACEYTRNLKDNNCWSCISTRFITWWEENLFFEMIYRSLSFENHLLFHLWTPCISSKIVFVMVDASHSVEMMKITKQCIVALFYVSTAGACVWKETFW